MTAVGQTNYARLTAAVWAFVVLNGGFILVSAAYLAGAVLLAGSITQSGWGHVPQAQMKPFELALAVYQGTTPVYNVGFVALTFWVVFEAARAIKFFGVRPRYAPWFASLSQVIPFALFYFPYAALGDTRKALKHIVETGAPPPKPQRGFDGPTFFLGVVTFVRLAANRGFEAAVGDPVTPTDTAGGLALMARIETTLIGETVVAILYIGVFVWFYLGVLRLYRRAREGAALSIASTVFDSPAGTGVPGAPLPE